MAEYIEREKVYHKLTGVCDGYCHGKMCKYTEYMLEEIEDIPAADVQPVKRGFWRKTNDIFYKYCSLCGTKTDIAYSNSAKFCPECGAKMDLPEAIKG